MTKIASKIAKYTSGFHKNIAQKSFKYLYIYIYIFPSLSWVFSLKFVVSLVDNLY